MNKMNLKTVKMLLEGSGFETELSDNSLLAEKEQGDTAWEVTIDTGGGLLAVKKKKTFLKNEEFVFKNKVIPIVCESVITETFRVQLENEKDFQTIEKKFDWA